FLEALPWYDVPLTWCSERVPMGPLRRPMLCMGMLVIMNLLCGVGAQRYSSDRRELSQAKERASRGGSLEEMLQDMRPEDLKQLILRGVEDQAQERRRLENHSISDNDDEALLERVGRLFVHWINNRLTPRSDPECSWDWGHWRCDPQCECKLAYRFGDYAPGRSCRLLRPEDVDPGCDPGRGDDVSLLEKLGFFVAGRAKNLFRFAADNVVPKTDDRCHFAPVRSLEERRMVCHPESVCIFKYKFGDVHLGRSCRLRAEGDKQPPALRSRYGRDGYGRDGYGRDGYGRDGYERDGETHDHDYEEFVKTRGRGAGRGRGNGRPPQETEMTLSEVVGAVRE
ncbi:unnamed protein product, partial [Discosporangium mesarthrocarpum]